MFIPNATYRIQFCPSFGFPDAEAILPYLHQLGVDTIYASPILKARRGSGHGYDVVDPARLNPELGTPDDFTSLNQSLKQRAMSWVQDIVPNHMAFDKENAWLMDVLEKGRASVFAGYFDVDWDYAHGNLKGRILAPFLGKFYAEALEEKEIQLTFSGGGFQIHYYDFRFPVFVATYSIVLEDDVGRLRELWGAHSEEFRRFQDLLRTIRSLPQEKDHRAVDEKTSSIKKTLGSLYEDDPRFRSYIDDTLERFNGVAKEPESFNRLDALLSRQMFRFSFWKVGTEEINYRRFFNINGLVSLRIEKRDVFESLHKEIFQLAEEGVFQGLRVDHIDGLFDPARYLHALRERLPESYLVVEKILDVDERMPLCWPVQGTSGYDFLNIVNGVFCQVQNKKAFGRVYVQFSGMRLPFAELMKNKKRLIMGKHMAGDIDNLARHMKRISKNDRYGSDITLYGLKRALVEVMAYFPVYRTYINGSSIGTQDRLILERTVKNVKSDNPGMMNELNFIENFLFLRFKDYCTEKEKREWIRFVMRFQQFTGPLMAKGFEDTGLYVYNRLLSLNEVGGAPETFGTSGAAFHHYNADKNRHWPSGMNATATHDTKRGEDVRARLNVLSELPEEWGRRLRVWRRLNRNKKKKLSGRSIPENNDEYFLYQTLLGTWPFDTAPQDDYADRIMTYIVKAVREAKVHTAWLSPDTEYEDAYCRFISRILDPVQSEEFLQDFGAFRRKIAYFGVYNSLSQTLLKMTSPGVPDFYQGAELWDFSLVDPDNRRPVDYEQRRRYLAEIKRQSGSEPSDWLKQLWRERHNGMIKMFLINKILLIRQRWADVFARGEYLAVDIEGTRKGHVLSFIRRLDDRWVLTAAPRFLTTVMEEEQLPFGRSLWEDTALLLPSGSPSAWRDCLTGRSLKGGERVPVGDIIQEFPVACLTGESGPKGV